jgi:hypothetical protein
MSTKNFRANNPDISALFNVIKLNTGTGLIYFQ